MDKVVWRAVIKPGRREDYIRRHDEIWPEMVSTLKAAGICNYTIWLDGDELFGYYECEKGAAFALDYQKKSPVVARWNVSMDDVMTMKEDGGGEALRLEKVFDLK